MTIKMSDALAARVSEACNSNKDFAYFFQSNYFAIYGSGQIPAGLIDEDGKIRHAGHVLEVTVAPGILYINDFQ